MLKNIRIVFVETTHPGNIGAVARAMKNMGLSELYLVKPKIFPHVDATARAAGADDILEKAHVVDSLDEALKGCELVVGTSARSRSLPMEVVSPRDGAVLGYKEAQQEHKVAMVFGRESSGLNNEELRKCHYQIFIPSVEGFSSLNLASAALLICYELRLAELVAEDEKTTASLLTEEYQLATVDEVEFFFNHLVQLIDKVGFLPDGGHKKLLLRIRRIFTRTRLEKKEVDILRGILAAIEKKISPNQ